MRTRAAGRWPSPPTAASWSAATAQPFPEGVLIRFTSAGVLDTTFGQAGVLSSTMRPESLLRAMDFHADGRLASPAAYLARVEHPPNYAMSLSPG